LKFTEIIPGEKLRPYIKCYFVFESETNIDDIVFPGGYMEMIFNLGEAIWRSATDHAFHKTPPVEFWGQITRPMKVRSSGKNSMLGIRFHPHTAAYFIKEDINELNDQVADLKDLLGKEVKTLHAKLMDISSLNERIVLIENFLLGRLAITGRIFNKIPLVGQVLKEMEQSDDTDNMRDIASRYEITPRYLQKLFIQCTGITPKFYSQINRFQRSLKLIKQRDESLTSIAYECGYFDQSHFIREFKSFTGITPSAYLTESYPINQALAATQPLSVPAA
jgi:AraC-like DNA-binding protein